MTDNKYFLHGRNLTVLFISMLLLTGALACTSTSQTPMSLRAEKDREAADEDTLESVTPEEIADVKTLEVFNRMHDENRHYLQLEHDTFMKTNRSLTKHVKAQKALFKGDTELAYEYISQGLNRDETADMLALKGSVYHSMGDNEKAEYYWNKAVERNTDVVSDLYPGLKYWYSQR